MDESILNTKVSEAIRATKELIQFLHENGISKWEVAYSDILNLLEAGDANGAIHLEKQNRYSGPGSMSDLILDNQKEFDVLWGRQGKSISNIRLFVEFEADRKSVYS
jgi:hypothetical protein